MTAIDGAILAAYLSVVLAIGLRLSRRMRTGADLFLAGRSLPWWAIGLSLVVSDIGAKDIVGLAQDGYRHGWVMANWDWLGCIPAMVLAAIVFVPYFWAGGFYTVPEYFGKRYNEGVRAIATVVWVLFIAGNVGVIFSAATGTIASFLGLEGYETWVLVGSAIFVGIYTSSGGLAAVVYTDAIQCVVMILGLAVVLARGLAHPSVGGWEAFASSIAAEHPDHLKLFHPAENPSSFTTFSVVFGLAVVMGPAYWIGNQVIVQRTLGARSLRDARAGTLFGALVKLAFPLLLVLPGILALRVIPFRLEGEATRRVFPELVKSLLPTGLSGLVLAAMVAGFMGNLDSYLNSAATLFTRDLVRRYVVRGPSDPLASGRLDLWLGRALTAAILTFGAVLSTQIHHIFETMQWMLANFQGSFLALLLFGMFSRRATGTGGLAGIVVGLGAAVFLNWEKDRLFGHRAPGGDWVPYANPYLHIAWWSFAAACVAIAAASFLTRPHPAGRLEGLVFGTRRGAGSELSDARQAL